MTELTCILCPKGCLLRIEKSTLYVSGNSCENGVDYAKAELCHPTRTLTGTVKLLNGALPRCPVRSSAPIPKELLPEAMAALSGLTLYAPVTLGQVLVENFLGTGTDLIITRTID